MYKYIYMYMYIYDCRYINMLSNYLFDNRYAHTTPLKDGSPGPKQFFFYSGRTAKMGDSSLTT